jgi:hypothetical protein
MSGAYCGCGVAGCIEDYAGECGRGFTTQTTDTSSDDPATELGIVLIAMLLWLRLKA